MLRPLVFGLALVAALLGTGVRAGSAAETIGPGFTECSVWSAFEDTNAPRQLDRVVLVAARELRGFAAGERGFVSGRFLFKGKESRYLAIWADVQFVGTLTAFTTLRNETVRFMPDGAWTPPRKVAFGILEAPPDAIGMVRPLALRICAPRPPPNGDYSRDKRVMLDASPNVAPLPPPPVPPVVVPEPRRIDDIVRDAAKKGGTGAAGPPAAEPPSSITDTLKRLAEGDESPPAKPPGVPSITDIVDGAAQKAAGPGVKAPPATPTPAVASLSVCRAGDLLPLAVAGSLDLTRVHTVGLRNERTSARGFDFIRITGGDIVSRDFMVDIADSAGRLVPFEQVGPGGRVLVGGVPVDVTPIAIAGLDVADARAVDAPAGERVVTLRFVVVGAPEEIAISGLGDVGVLLARSSGKGIGVAIDWYSVDSAGNLAAPETFGSFEDLVAAAAARADGDRFLVLDEAAFFAFMDNFGRMLGSRAAPLDRVIWVKGAYKLPNGAPKRIEEFIGSAAGLSAIPRRPNGPERWLIVVTARMPGFGVAYLKEPIYSLAAGEVLDEPADNNTSPRRLIVDPQALATALKSIAVVRAGSAGANLATPKPVVTDLLVVNADEVLAERGFAMSMEAADSLVESLARLAAIWDGGGNLVEAELRSVAAEIGVSSPSVAEVLQRVPEGGLRLPRSLPSWTRTAISSLSPPERGNARTFVSMLLGNATKLKVNAARMLVANPAAKCGLVYVPDAYLGLGS